MRRILAVSFGAILLVMGSGSAEAGPVRKFIQKHRPGILIPKRIAPSPIAKAPMARPVQMQPSACVGGVCPLPRR